MEKQMQNTLKNFKKECKGIGLTTLVIVVIIILIIVGIIIGFIVAKNNGVFDKNTNAISEVNELEKDVETKNKIINKNNTVKDTVQDNAVSLAEVTGNETTNTLAKDKLGNRVLVPAGFKVVNSNEDVTKGIIIEDVTANDNRSKGNQYVWIPVGNIKTENGETKTIELGRYDFDKTTGVAKALEGEHYKEETEEEHKISGAKNQIAKNIEDFKASVNSHGGYYLARYEAGDTRADANREDGANQAIIPVFKENQIVYNNVTQIAASNLTKNLYSKYMDKYTSDLVNSYAWDTAIIFIQTFGGSKSYSRQSALQSELVKTGESADTTGKKDEMCHIFDMAGSANEWTTETATGLANSSSVIRGGSYKAKYDHVSDRLDSGTNAKDVGFRRSVIY